jgi:alpha-tubulin suppressor-like RCC1 family protein
VTLADDEVLCWGAPNRTATSRVPALDPPTPVTLPDGEPLVVERLIANLGTLCAIAKSDGALWCWGDGFGLEPVRMPQTGVVDIALGARHSCVIDAAGLACWGDDRNAQVTGDVARARACGDGPCELAEPVHVALDATRVVVGERHTCALLADRSIACWGSNEVGQLGRTDAFLVGGIGFALADATALAAGFAHTCARRFDNSVWCWGATAFGEE